MLPKKYCSQILHDKSYESKDFRKKIQKQRKLKLKSHDFTHMEKKQEGTHAR